MREWNLERWPARHLELWLVPMLAQPVDRRQPELVKGNRAHWPTAEHTAGPHIVGTQGNRPSMRRSLDSWRSRDNWPQRVQRPALFHKFGTADFSTSPLANPKWDPHGPLTGLSRKGPVTQLTSPLKVD